MFSPVFPCSNAAGQLKHKYKKSFQNIVFHRVFTPNKNTVIYMFLAMKSVQNTSFCNVFNALASKNLSEYRYLYVFFTFRRLLHCRKPTKMTQNSMLISILLSSDTQKSLRNLAPSAARAIQGHNFFTPSDPSNGCFFHFPARGGFPSYREFQTATKTTPRKTIQTKFSAVTYILFSPQNPPNRFFKMCLHVFVMVSFKTE